MDFFSDDPAHSTYSVERPGSESRTQRKPKIQTLMHQGHKKIKKKDVLKGSITYGKVSFKNLDHSENTTKQYGCRIRQNDRNKTVQIEDILDKKSAFEARLS